MNLTVDPHLLVRAASIYIVVVLTAAVWVWRRPSRRELSGAALASFWNLPAVLALDLAASRVGWWQFDARGGVLLGLPVDLYLSWAWLWGALPALACPAWPIALVGAAALAIDLVLMPAAAPVVRLGPWWLAGEAVGLLFGFLPGQLLARWTVRDERLVERAALQVVAFTGLVLFVIPSIAVEGSGSVIANPFSRPAWQWSLFAQLLAVPAVVGVTAVQEFVTRGGGTPVPFDPPRRLVTSGIYSYVGNPMQLSGVVLLIVMGLALRNLWVSVGGVMAHFYSIGIAGWDEDEDLRQRFGSRWTEYRRSVGRWVPRLQPWHPPEDPPARLFVGESCAMCRDVARWFEARGTHGLIVVAAESHPSGSLTRITYEPADGSQSASGVEAVARALEHVHLGWAMLGFLMRLPIVRPMIQVLVDASGGHARTLTPQVRSGVTD